MFHKAFLLNPNMLPCSLLTLGEGRGTSWKNVQQGSSLLGSRRCAVPLVRKEVDSAWPCTHFSLSPFRGGRVNDDQRSRGRCSATF